MEYLTAMGAELNATPLERKFPRNESAREAVERLSTEHAHYAVRVDDLARRVADALRDSARLNVDECHDDELRRLLTEVVGEVNDALGILDQIFDESPDFDRVYEEASEQIDLLAFVA